MWYGVTSTTTNKTTNDIKDSTNCGKKSQAYNLHMKWNSGWNVFKQNENETVRRTECAHLKVPKEQ